MCFPNTRSAALTFSIDDCWRKTVDIFLRIMLKESFRATFNVISGLVGRKINSIEFADWSSLKKIAKLGNELASHSHTHKSEELNLTDFVRRISCGVKNETPARLIRRAVLTLKSDQRMHGMSHLSFKEEIKLSKRIIENVTGASCVSYAYPEGKCGQRLKKLVKTSGYLSARASYIGFNFPRSLDMYALRVQVWDRTTDAKLANKWVDEAICRKAWLIEVLHAFGSDDYLYNASLESYNDHLDYLERKSNLVWIAPQRQVAEYLIRLRNTSPEFLNARGKLEQ